MYFFREKLLSEWQSFQVKSQVKKLYLSTLNFAAEADFHEGRNIVTKYLQTNKQTRNIDGRPTSEKALRKMFDGILCYKQTTSIDTFFRHLKDTLGLLPSLVLSLTAKF